MYVIVGIYKDGAGRSPLTKINQRFPYEIKMCNRV